MFGLEALLPYFAGANFLTQLWSMWQSAQQNRRQAAAVEETRRKLQDPSLYRLDPTTAAQATREAETKASAAGITPGSGAYAQAIADALARYQYPLQQSRIHALMGLPGYPTFPIQSEGFGGTMSLLMLPEILKILRGQATQPGATPYPMPGAATPGQFSLYPGGGGPQFGPTGLYTTLPDPDLGLPAGGGPGLGEF